PFRFDPSGSRARKKKGYFSPGAAKKTRRLGQCREPHPRRHRLFISIPTRHSSREANRGKAMSRYLLPAAGLLALATAALANDSTATTGAGGLVLRQTADIDMVSEDLYVSVEQIRVHYVFRNRTPRDVSVTIAFP